MITRELERLGKDETINTALDLAFDKIDDAFLEGNFEWVDQFLQAADVDKMSVALLIGILTITASTSKLSHRADFRSRAEETIRKRGRYDERLLRGL